MIKSTKEFYIPEKIILFQKKYLAELKKSIGFQANLIKIFTYMYPFKNISLLKILK